MTQPGFGGSAQILTLKLSSRWKTTQPSAHLRQQPWTLTGNTSMPKFNQLLSACQYAFRHVWLAGLMKQRHTAWQCFQIKRPWAFNPAEILTSWHSLSLPSDGGRQQVQAPASRPQHFTNYPILYWLDSHNWPLTFQDFGGLLPDAGNLLQLITLRIPTEI